MKRSFAGTLIKKLGVVTVEQTIARPYLRAYRRLW
jgi:hypothetical protein